MKKKTFITILLALVAFTANALLLFRISGNGLAAPSYIVGTYHIVDESFVDSIVGIRQAFRVIGTGTLVHSLGAMGLSL